MFFFIFQRYHDIDQEIQYEKYRWMNGITMFANYKKRWTRPNQKLAIDYYVVFLWHFTSKFLPLKTQRRRFGKIMLSYYNESLF